MRKEFTATAFIFNKDRSKVLLILHKKLQKWLPPGGHIDPNEYPHDAVVREIKEETGLNVTFIHHWHDLAIQDPNEHQIPTPYCLLSELIPAYKDNDEHIHMDFIYLVEAEETTIVEQEQEILAARWFLKHEVMTLDSFDSIYKVCDRFLVDFAEKNEKSAEL
jgi:8-oxo-dGTP diphosphatase